MKTKISRIDRKSLSVIIALMMIVSTMLVGMVSVNAATKLYLDPNGKWSIGSNNVTNFIAYFYNNGGNTSSVMSVEVSANNIYSVTAPDGYSNVVFVAATSDTLGDGWSNKVYQTVDLNFDSTKNLCTLGDKITEGSNNGKYNGSMSAYSGGSTTYTIKKGTETNGKFSVSPTSAAEGTEVTVNTSPNSGYEVDKVTYSRRRYSNNCFRQ